MGRRRKADGVPYKARQTSRDPVENDEFLEKNQYEEYPVYLPQEYPKRFQKDLLY